ncbi:MAG: efflux RND transporter periplasmic adaptor subunit [Saprospiraceae bacterium]|nr:efflux RND transporter periplasmic adaptor subunit [Saprospiraceae bacterium]
MRLGISLLFLILLVSSGCSEQKTGIKPEHRDLIEAVYSTVNVEPKLSYSVYPQVGGIIEKIFIQQGDTIHQGDPIVKITNKTIGVNVENARLQFEVAKNAFEGESTLLKEMMEQIETAQSIVANDSINYERQKRLWAQNVGSRLEFEKRELAYDRSKNDLARLYTSYNRTRDELERKMEMASNSLKINKLNAADYTLRSKLDGMVYSVDKEEGESVSPQSPIAFIGSEDDFIIVLRIDEVDISKVMEGQKIIITLDAYPNSTFEAKVVKIFPEKDERSLTVRVEADFVTRPNRLLKGLSGEANILIRERKNVLTIPSQYLNEDGMVQTDNGMVAVKTGIKSLEFTEVIEGIDSTTVIKILE